MGVCSDGSYGVQPGLVYSFPCSCEKGIWPIAQGPNALVLKESAPSILDKKNTACLTRLDRSRALSHVSDRLSVRVRDVKNVIIWGNHSSTQYIFTSYATDSTEKLVRELVADDH